MPGVRHLKIVTMGGFNALLFASGKQWTFTVPSLTLKLDELAYLRQGLCKRSTYRCS